MKILRSAIFVLSAILFFLPAVTHADETDEVLNYLISKRQAERILEMKRKKRLEKDKHNRAQFGASPKKTSSKSTRRTRTRRSHSASR